MIKAIKRNSRSSKNKRDLLNESFISREKAHDSGISSSGDKYDKSHYKTAGLLVFIGTLIYILFRIIGNWHTNAAEYSRNSVIAGTLFLLFIYIIHKWPSKYFDPAFLLPLILFCGLNVSQAITKGVADFYFSIYMVLCAISAVYCNKICFLQFTLITEIANIILIALRVPYIAGTQGADVVPAQLLIAHEQASVFLCILLYLIVNYVSNKNIRSARSEDAFLTLFASISNMIAVVDELNRIVRISKTIIDFTGIKDEKYAEGRPIFDLFSDIEFKLVIGEALKHKGNYMNITQLNINGDSKHLSIRSGELKGLAKWRYIDMTDITDLVEARIEAERATKTKSKFLASMSHEIRTPMNAIIGMSELMPQNNLNEIQLGYFNDIKKMSYSLLDIINDILDFSKIEAGKMKLVPVHYNIHSLFDNVSSICAFIAAGKSLDFTASRNSDVPEILFGDEQRMRQVMMNIVNNAVKYTQNAGFVRFSLSLGSHPDDARDFLIACVEDSGIGIKQENLSKLFESFERFDMKKNRAIEGTGLGLAIAKSCVDMMGGYIEVESEYGKGSKFIIYFPLVLGDKNQVAVQIENEPIVKARNDTRVLVVDDTAVNLTVARGFLSSHGITAETAPGGYEAIDMINTALKDGKPFDLIFMDHMMPVIDGIETTEKIRAMEAENKYYKTLPIIALTANAVKGTEELFLASGMNGFVSKPIEAAVLNRMLSLWLPKDKIIQDENAGPQNQNAEFVSTENAVVNPVVNNENARALFIKALSGIKDIKVEKGLYYFQNDIKGYKTALRQFCSTLEKELDIASKALSEENWKIYSGQVHALKGVLATLGSLEFSNEAKRLEFAAKSADKKLCFTNHDAFKNGLLSLRDNLKNTIIFEDIETQKQKIEAGDFIEKLKELVAACDSGRPDAVDAAAEKLRTVIYNESTSKTLKDIFSCLETMDYDDAASLCYEIIAELKK